MAVTSSLLVISILVVSAQAQSVNLILADGASGSTVVDATVSRIQQTCIFGDDKRFLRRLAYVETLDGTDTAAFNGGRNGGIWKITNAMFNSLSNSALSSFKTSIMVDLNINWARVAYNDLRKPLYSALAAALYTKYIIATNARFSEVPRSISDQANFRATYYRPGSSSSTFSSRATAFENKMAKCNVGADIVFLLDESGSIGSTNYVTEKNFVAKVIQNLVIGPTANQVGVITYSSSTMLDIKLNRYSDQTSLMNAVTRLTYLGGGTATHLALKQLADVAFASGNGARPKGKGHPRVGIVLTDGGSNNGVLTQIEATRAKDQDIILFSVGVGTNINIKELEGMASDPTCLHYSQLNSGFSEILDLVSSISATTCNVPVSFEPNNTLVRPVDKDVPYNCEITVPPQGVTVHLITTKGSLTLFLSNATYPNQAYYDVKISVISGTAASVYIPPGQKMTYCSILSQEKTNVTIVTMPGQTQPTTTPGTSPQPPSTYNCAQGRNPCTSRNLDQGIYMYPHDFPSRYVQCGGINQCFDMNCPSRLVWDQQLQGCNWPTSGSGGSSNSGGPGSGFTCAPPNPCTSANIAANHFYFPHRDPYWFVQCDEHGGCFEMPCAQGTQWKDAYKTCDHRP